MYFSGCMFYLRRLLQYKYMDFLKRNLQVVLIYLLCAVRMLIYHIEHQNRHMSSPASSFMGEKKKVKV